MIDYAGFLKQSKEDEEKRIRQQQIKNTVGPVQPANTTTTTEAPRTGMIDYAATLKKIQEQGPQQQQLQQPEVEQKPRGFIPALQEAGERFYKSAKREPKNLLLGLLTLASTKPEEVKAAEKIVSDSLDDDDETNNLIAEINDLRLQTRTGKEITGRTDGIVGTGLFARPTTRDLSPEELQEKKDRLQELEEQYDDIERQREEDSFLISQRRKLAKNIIEQRQEDEQYFIEKYGETDELTARWALNILADNSISTISSVAAAAITGFITRNPTAARAVGVSSSYIQESSGAYQNAVSEGLSEDDALKVAAQTGAINSALELMPIGNYLNKKGYSELKKNIFKRTRDKLIDLTVSGTIEGTTESVQEFAANVIISEYQENPDLFEGIPESFVAGSITGTAFDLVTPSAGNGNKPVISKDALKATSVLVADEEKQAEGVTPVETPAETPVTQEPVETPTETPVTQEPAETPAETPTTEEPVTVTEPAEGQILTETPAEKNKIIKKYGEDLTKLTQSNFNKIVETGKNIISYSSDIANKFYKKDIDTLLFGEVTDRDKKVFFGGTTEISEDTYASDGKVYIYDTETVDKIIDDRRSSLETKYGEDSESEYASQITASPYDKNEMKRNQDDDRVNQKGTVLGFYKNKAIVAYGDNKYHLFDADYISTLLDNYSNRPLDIYVSSKGKPRLDLKDKSSGETFAYLLGEEVSKADRTNINNIVTKSLAPAETKKKPATKKQTTSKKKAQPKGTILKDEELSDIPEGGTYSAEEVANLPSEKTLDKTLGKKAVPYPVLIELANTILKGKVKVSKIPSRRGGIIRGFFRPLGDGTIVLNADIFNDVNQVAKTLAHELGHLIDYLPDQYMKRGNLLGRLGSLRKFTRDTFTNTKEAKQITKLLKENDAYREERRTLRAKVKGKIVVPKKNKAKDLALYRKIRDNNKKIAKLNETAINNKDVYKELIELSLFWRPLVGYKRVMNEQTGEVEIQPYDLPVSAALEKLNTEYGAYRKRPEELYADAISVLLNDPDLLKEKAPIFYKSFFANLENKPEVRQAYFDTLDYLENATDDDIASKQLDNLYQGMDAGRKAYEDIQDKKNTAFGWATAKENLNKAYNEFLRQYVSKFDPLYKQFDDTLKDNKIFSSTRTQIRMVMEQISYSNNEAALKAQQHKDTILRPLFEIGLKEEDLGALLIIDRTLQDRKDIANPYGLQGQYAQKAKDYLYTYLTEKKNRKITPEQFNVLQQIAVRFKKNMFETMQKAYDAGLIDSETFNFVIKPNKNSYVAFQVVDYIQSFYVDTEIKQQVGTFKEVANPVVSNMLKVMAIESQIVRNTAKQTYIKEALKDVAASGVTKAKMSKGVKALAQDYKINKNLIVKAKKSPLGFAKVKDRELLILKEKGQWVGYNVDPYIAGAFNTMSPTEVSVFIKAAGKFNEYVKKLYTTYNLTFGFYNNIIKDNYATYKKLSAIAPHIGNNQNLSIADWLKTWVGSIGEAYQFEKKGEIQGVLADMYKDKAYQRSFFKTDVFANNQNELVDLFTEYSKSKAFDTRNPDRNFFRRFVDEYKKMLEFIKVGVGTFETTTKIAGYKVLQNREVAGKEKGFIVRNYVGTPNYLDGGTQKYVANRVFIFQNVMVQGIRSDLKIATDPKTAQGYWYKTFLTNVAPKLAMRAAAAGLLGEGLKEIFDRATEYDKRNYLIIPLGLRENGEAVYWRIPQDQTGQFIGGLVWNLTDEDLKVQDIGASFFNSIISQYTPSPTPLLTISGYWIDYAQGRNPYDSYRGRSAVDDYTWKSGGLDRFIAMVKLTTNELGLMQFNIYDDPDQTNTDFIIDNILFFNRIIKSTDYGLREKADKITKEIDKAQAKRYNAEKSELTKTYKVLKDDPNQAINEINRIIDTLYSDETNQAVVKARYDAIRQKVKVFLLKERVPNSLDIIIDEPTLEGKGELFDYYASIMSSSDFKDLYRTAREAGIITRGLQPYLNTKEVRNKLK